MLQFCGGAPLFGRAWGSARTLVGYSQGRVFAWRLWGLRVLASLNARQAGTSGLVGGSASLFVLQAGIIPGCVVLGQVRHNGLAHLCLFCVVGSWLLCVTSMLFWFCNSALLCMQWVTFGNKAVACTHLQGVGSGNGML